MSKNKKLTLREEFDKMFTESDSVPTPEQIWTFFIPYVKKQPTSKVAVNIPEDELTDFNNTWPTHKLPTGQYGRSSIPDLKSAFTYFFTTFPTYTDWAIIQRAADSYLNERELEKYEWTRRSKYFVRRQLKDGSTESPLAEYYERILNGTQESPEEVFTFDVKVY